MSTIPNVTQGQNPPAIPPQLPFSALVADLIAADRNEDAYQLVISYGIWLENHGAFARYAIGNEESVWVNHDLEIIQDPDEAERETEEAACWDNEAGEF
ncbi:hypothetical protein SAMN02949497_1726 [Methylomagnum ishizawai]|uniref:Uncharacterized protein n=1 Tax=Methylomagnum ishizawai TaxID=1760988 RepID=A0A1Y6CVI3_9GAMM|nr:hypothetical protein [Methylomagnum ishizawai]SMF94411.1 hypothetical protein SAMN02949497_1726 [Methylomagnum ishizawai]